MHLYDEQGELDAAFCDICGYHHSPDCYESQWEEDDD